MSAILMTVHGCLSCRISCISIHVYGIIICFPQINHFFLITNISATFEKIGDIEICLKVGNSFYQPT